VGIVGVVKLTPDVVLLLLDAEELLLQLNN
jgi:hypothetical protein